MGHINLERNIFDLFEYPFVGKRISLLDGKALVAEGCVRGQEYVCPHVMYVFSMHRLVKCEVFGCIISGGTKKWILLRESSEDFTDIFVMHKT